MIRGRSKRELSPGTRENLDAQRRGLLESISRVRDGAVHFRCLADQLEEEALDLERLVQNIEAVLGVAPQMELADEDDGLRGKRLRDVAVAILEREFGPGHIVHYRDWLGVLEAEGHRVGGKDPVATFLLQIGKAENVERVGHRTGRYRLIDAA